MLEKDIQKQICEWLALKGVFFWRSNNMPVFSEGKFRAMPKYAPKGLPDIICVIKGRFVGLEVKRPKGYTNPKTRYDQETFCKNVRNNGGFYAVVHSIDEAQIAIQEMV